MFTEAQVEELLAYWSITIDGDSYELRELNGVYWVFDLNHHTEIGSGATAEDAIANSYRYR